MNFKEEYKELQNNISPDADFLEQLAEKMEHRKQEQAKKQANRKKPLMLFISAAVICTGAAAAAIVVLNIPKPQPAPIPVVGNSDKLSYTVGIFAEKEVFSDDAPVPEQLSKMLSDSETVLYKNNENKFEFSDKLNSAQRTALSEKIKNAAETSSGLGKNIEYYMAVLESGDVVKFRISGDVLAVNEKIYKIS